MKLSFCVFCVALLGYFQLSSCTLTVNGSVAIHSLIFEKIINAFEYVLVKFDEPFSYGENEEVYKDIAKMSIGIPNMLAATVGIADYAEKENSDLAERYKIVKANFPAYRLFKRDPNNPIVYDGPINRDALKTFVSEHTGAYVGLDGCLEKFDKLAQEFVTGEDALRKGVVASMKTHIDELKVAANKDELVSAENYLKIASKIQENGLEFVSNEQSRLRKLIDGNISDNKKVEIKQRLNILQSFQQRDADKKSEL